MRLRHLFLIATLFIAGAAHALSADEVKGIAFGDVEARVTALNKAAADADEKTVAFIQALSDDAVKTRGDKVFVIQGGKALDPLSGAEVPLPPDAEDVINPNYLRSEMDNALAALKLLSKDEATRAAAIKTLTGETDEARLPLIDKAYAVETVPQLKDKLEMMRAAILLGSSDKARRLDAAAQLAGSKNPITKTVLIERLPLETDADVKVALKAALARVEASLAWGDRLGAMFSGISLGSILLLVALGLAITYGLMGVINMAHGELMMIGAYATYVVQGLFQKYLPGAFDWYLLAAVPVAFLASALMGALLERSVIRFLYGRPLETLL
ncbi:MAG: urea ABC transporter permease subunit UrtB, partial [Burkholderiaceae bacterium]|nr:urea ABC transporter permease subunit UrtB [Burkholderiaceae bacterium]